MILGFEMEIYPSDGGLDPGRRVGHLDDDPASPGVHRQATRHAKISRRHGLRRRARYRRDRRIDRQNGVHRIWFGLCAQISDGRHAGFGKMYGRPAAGLVRGATPAIETSTRSFWAWAILSAHGFPALWWPAAFLSYLVLVPAIKFFGEGLTTPLYPATTLISTMDADAIRRNYILYIGAGAVATGGIIGLCRALPLIFSSHSFRLARHGKLDAVRPAMSRVARIVICRCGSSLSARFCLIAAIWVFLGRRSAGRRKFHMGRTAELDKSYRGGADCLVRIPFCHGLFAIDRRNRFVVKSHLRHDRCHIAFDVPDLPYLGLDQCARTG